MRLSLRIAVVGALAAALVSVSAPLAAAQPADPAPYYLALGDSLAQGVQPNASGRSVVTNQGYVDDLFAVLRLSHPGLRLAKLGCPGEKTGTMIHGGICPYPMGAQLAQAVSFLGSHRVVLVTLDIGANNIDGCLTAAGIDQACIAQGLAAAARDLPAILTALHQAGFGGVTGSGSGSGAVGGTVPTVAMNYYDPFLAVALKGPTGQALARQSEQLTLAFNNILGTAYAAFGIPVADVQGAFLTENFTMVPFLNLPLNTLIICVYTWMCSPAPVGPNIHPTPAGYLVIALAFLPKIGSP